MCTTTSTCMESRPGSSSLAEPLTVALEVAAHHVHEQWGDGSAIRQNAGAATAPAMQAVERWNAAATAWTDWAARQDGGGVQHNMPGMNGQPTIANLIGMPPTPSMYKRVLAAMHTTCMALTAPPAALYAGAGDGVTVGDGDLGEMGDSEPRGEQALGVREKELLRGLQLIFQSLISLIPHTLRGALVPDDDDDAYEDEVRHHVQTGHGIGSEREVKEDNQGIGVGSSAMGPVGHTPLIQVLDDDSDDDVEGGAGEGREMEEARKLAQQLAHDLILLGLTWVNDVGLPEVWVVPGRGGESDEGVAHSMSEGDITFKGTCVAASSPALYLIQQLAKMACVADARPQKANTGGRGNTTLVVTSVPSVGDLLTAEAGTLLPSLRHVVVSGGAAWAASHKHDDVYVERPQRRTLKQRLLAAHQLSVLIRILNHRHLSQVMEVALPAALAAAQDPSPVVAVQGMWALTHMAIEGLAADMRWQSALLIDAASRMVVSCQDSTWRAACTCATALICTVLGSEPRAAGYHTLMGEMLNEMERHGHKHHRRVTFLSEHVIIKMIQAMGLTVLRHNSRLLPLLLEWLQSYDLVSRESSIRTIHELIRHTWPRTPIHAPALWHHVSAMCLRETADGIQAQRKAGGADEISRASVQGAPGSLVDVEDVLAQLRGVSGAVAWGVRAMDLLVVCGGQAFREAVSITQKELLELAEEDEQRRVEAQGGEGVSGGQPRRQEKALVSAATLVRTNPNLYPVLMALVVHVEKSLTC